MGLYNVFDRLAYEIDGTSCWVNDGAGGLTAVTGSALSNLNKETASGSVTIPAGGALIFLFPRTGDTIAYRDLYGVSIYGSGSGTYSVEYSGNSTNGIDGGWVSSATSRPLRASSLVTDPVYNRTVVTTTSSATSGAVRYVFTSSTTITTVHLCGRIVANGANELLFMNGSTGSSGDYSRQAFDGGDCERGTTLAFPTDGGITGFLRNPAYGFSPKTANSITLSFDSPTPPSPSGLSEHQVKVGTGSWGTTATITSIAPGALSAGIYVRRLVGAGTPAGSQLYRLRWTVGSWS